MLEEIEARRGLQLLTQLLPSERGGNHLLAAITKIVILKGEEDHHTQIPPHRQFPFIGKRRQNKHAEFHNGQIILQS